MDYKSTKFSGQIKFGKKLIFESFMTFSKNHSKFIDFKFCIIQFYRILYFSHLTIENIIFPTGSHTLEKTLYNL